MSHLILYTWYGICAHCVALVRKMMLSWLVHSIGCVPIGQHCLGGGYDVLDNIVFVVVVDVCLLDRTNQEDDDVMAGI